MFKKIPNWMPFAFCVGFFIGMFGMMPAAICEILVYGSINLEIVKYALIISAFFVVYPLLYKDFREDVFRK